MTDERFRNLRVGELIPSRWQVRNYPYDGDGFEGLKASIQRHGVLNRLRVFVNEEGVYEMITGHRRLAAAKDVGKERVPVEVVTTLRDRPTPMMELQQIHEEVIVDNLYHEDLTPIEEAKAIAALMEEHGHTQQEAAHVLGKSQQWVSDRLSLLNLAPAVQRAVTERAVEMTVGKSLATLPPQAQVPVMKRLKETKATSREAAIVVAKVAKALEPGFWDLPEDEPLEASALNTKRLVDHYLGQVPEEKMAEVVTCLEKNGMLAPPQELRWWVMDRFARCCGVEAVEWDDLAREKAWTCENCVWKGEELHWRCKEEDTVSCYEYLAEGDPVRLPVLEAEDCQTCEEETGWCTDVGCRIEHLKKRDEERADEYEAEELAFQIEEQERRQRFYERQQAEDVDRGHWLAQPCEHCRLFLGPEHRVPCADGDLRRATMEFWVGETSEGVAIVPRCSEFRMRDLRPIRELQNISALELTINLLERRYKDRPYGLYWLYEGKSAEFRRFLKGSELSAKQLLAVLAMEENREMVPFARKITDWKQMNPATGEYSTWKLLEESEEAEVEESSPE